MEKIRLKYDSGELKPQRRLSACSESFQAIVQELCQRRYDLGDAPFEFFLSYVDIDAGGTLDRCMWNQNVFVDYTAAIRALTNQLKERGWGNPSDNKSKEILGEVDWFYKTASTASVVYMPIVHVAKDDILRGAALDITGSGWRARGIVDSSIWNYFFPFSQQERFLEILQDIKGNYDNHYYALKITNEYADFAARQLREDYLEGDHKNDVVPFVFHSESRMKTMLMEEMEVASLSEIKHRLCCGLKWRFLLVDDKIGTSEDGYLSTTCCSGEKLTKIDIVKNRLQLLGFKVGELVCKGGPCDIRNAAVDNDIDKIDILLVCVDNIDTAKSLIKEYEFDIILMDYLLGNFGEQVAESEKSRVHRYGHEFLSWLQGEEVNINSEEAESGYSIGAKNTGKVKVGPGKRLFFMFMSAFSTAVSERLRNSGLLRSRPRWHIGEGSCPTNTPYLFLYQLAMLMRKRLEDLGILDLAKDKKVNDILYDIYNSDKVKKAADDRFKEILSLLYNYKSLLMDVSVPETGFGVFKSRGSVLCTSFMMSEGKQRVGSLLEHAVHMVYLTAFGTVRQWPEIWEESRYLSTQINNDALCAIESYIFKLKTEN